MTELLNKLCISFLKLDNNIELNINKDLETIVIERRVFSNNSINFHYTIDMYPVYEENGKTINSKIYRHCEVTIYESNDYITNKLDHIFSSMNSELKEKLLIALEKAIISQGI